MHSTYADKPMQGRDLKLAVARVNRVRMTGTSSRPAGGGSLSEHKKRISNDWRRLLVD